jgi:hypothetical protein
VTRLAGVIGLIVATLVGPIGPTETALATSGAPAVTGLSPHFGPVSGGTVLTVTGRGFATGATVTFGRDRGAHVQIVSSSRLFVTAPAHPVVSLFVRVRTSAGSSAAGAASSYGYVAAPAGIELTGPGEFPSSAGQPVGLSCPTAVFCAALTLSGFAVLDHSGAWAKPVRVSRQAAGPADISCASASFCVAVDLNGDARIFDGSRWQPAVAVVPGSQSDENSPIAVSCPTASFCMVVTQSGEAIRYNGARWIAMGFVTDQSRQDDLLEDVSCASSSFCYAVGSSGVTVRYRDGQWGRQHVIDTRPGDLMEVSCPTATFCATLTPNGIRMYTGTTWSKVIGAGLGLVGGGRSMIDCPSARFCVAGHTDQVSSRAYVAFDGASASTLPVPGVDHANDPVAVSCWAAGACGFVGAGSSWRSG